MTTATPGTYFYTETGKFDLPLVPPSEDESVLFNITPGSTRGLIRLRLNLKLYLFSNGRKDPSGKKIYAKYLLADLNGTEVNPGVQFSWPGGKSIRGWFTSAVNITMGFANNDHDIELMTDMPQTSAFQGVSSSSISQNLGFGFFGKTGTGTENTTITNTFSYDVEGFEVTNTSDTVTLQHAINMSASSGGVYTGPPSLYHHPSPELYLPPKRATSNLGLPSQGLWLAQASHNSGLSSSPISATVPFQVSIAHTVTWVQLELFTTSPVHMVSPASKVSKHPKSWIFNIDFSNLSI